MRPSRRIAIAPAVEVPCANAQVCDVVSPKAGFGRRRSRPGTGMMRAFFLASGSSKLNQPDVIVDKSARQIRTTEDVHQVFDG